MIVMIFERLKYLIYWFNEFDWNPRIRDESLKEKFDIFFWLIAEQNKATL